MDVHNSDELCHYGIQGMKWGIRRFQNKDGSYTTAGKQRYTNKAELKKDIKTENKKSKTYGLEATVYEKAHNLSKRKTEKALKSYNKAKDNNSSEKRIKRKKLKYEAAKKTESEMLSERMKTEKRLKEHYDSLIKKFGKEYVEDIKYNKKGGLNEAEDSKRVAMQIVAGLGAMAMAGITGFGIAYAPKTSSEMARSIVNIENAINYGELKKKQQKPKK